VLFRTVRMQVQESGDGKRELVAVLGESNPSSGQAV
jgi:hypothetical protein